MIHIYDSTNIQNSICLLTMSMDCVNSDQLAKLDNHYLKKKKKKKKELAKTGEKYAYCMFLSQFICSGQTS